MFFFKEKEILEILDKFQKNSITIDKMREFAEKSYNEILNSNLILDDNSNFLRYKKYLSLLINILQNKIDKSEINSYIYMIKAEDFIERIKFSNKDTTCKIEEIDKPLLYFDNNIFIYLKENVPLNQIDKLTKKYQFVYSPAHLEELANSIRKNNFEYNDKIKFDLYYLSKLTNNIEFLPHIDQGIIIRSESPYCPLKRVIKDFDGTVLSEQIEENFLKKRNKKEMKERFLMKIGKSNWYMEYQKEPKKEIFWEKHKSNYEFLFTTLDEISALFDILDTNPEPIEKYRSHLHDTTHLIYATQSDVFITNDKKLGDKADKIYKFFGIPTKIIDYKYFLKNFL